MDMRIQFTNPDSVGCGSDPVIHVDVYNASPSNLVTSTTVTYDEGNSGFYTVNIDAMEYIASGFVLVYVTTTDTNSSDRLEGDSSNAGFTGGALPIFRNMSSVAGTSSAVTFDVITQDALKPTAAYIYITGGVQITVPWLTQGNGTTIQVDISTLTNGEQLYSYTILPGAFGLSSWPNNSSKISVSNNAGINSNTVT